MGLAKSSRISIHKKRPSALERTLERTGQNCMLLGSFAFAFLVLFHGVCLMLISFGDERRYLPLGSPSGPINYYHAVSLWTLLHLTMVPPVDVHCKCDSLDFFSHLDVSHNELLSEISLPWTRISAFGLESGKFN